MGLAPSIKELREAADKETVAKEVPPVKEKKKMAEKKSVKKAPIKKETKREQRLPPVLPFRVYGCGGAGRMAATRAFGNHITDVVTIDTTKGMKRTVAGVQAIRISDLNGSGKARGTNAEVIEDFVSTYVKNVDFPEVSIVIFSLSGGSGSVIGPKIVSKILESGKIAIVITIADVDSEIDANNAMKTLQSLNAITRITKSYLPMMLFSNEYGRFVVDKGIDDAMDKLTRLLTVRFFGSDLSDRINFFRPTNVIPRIKPGIRLLNLSEGESGDWAEDMGLIINHNEFAKIDSTLIISAIDAEITRGIRPSVSFRGYFEDNNEIALIASLGYSIPKEFMQVLNAEIVAYRDAEVDEETEIGYEDDDMDDGFASGDGMSY